MDRSWRPRPISDHSRPNFDPNGAPPINMDRYPHHVDAYSDSRFWHRNPSSETENYGSQFQMQQPVMGDHGNSNRGGLAILNFEHSGSTIDSEFRNSKRLRIDGAHHGSYWSDVDPNLSRVPLEENERRLQLIRDHGGLFEDQGLSGQDSQYGFSGKARGYVQENSFFGMNNGEVQGGRHANFGETGVGPTSNFRDGGYGIHRQKEDDHFGFGLQSHYSDMNGNQLAHGSLGNQLHSEDRQQPPYGQGRNPSHPEAFGHGGVGSERYSSLQMGDFVRQSHGHQHTTHGSFDSGNWKDFRGHSAYEQRSNIKVEDQYSFSHQPNIVEQHGQMKYSYRASSFSGDARLRGMPPALNGYEEPTGCQSFPVAPQHGPPDMRKQGAYGDFVSPNIGHLQASRGFDTQPPLPPSPPPPPPLPLDPAGHTSSSPPRMSSSIFPVAVSSLASAHSSYPPVPEVHSLAQSYLHGSQPMHVSDRFSRDSQVTTQASSQQYFREAQPYPPKNKISDKPKIVDASQLFKPPHRATRPDHFVIILRGLPGSGKSYLAKMLRDVEVEYGGDAPRIHSMDDYFMTEVEKVDEMDASKSSVRGKKAAMKKVLEYCYEPEMEEAYRSSMLKAFKKTLEEGVYTFVIVDDRNLRVADFAQFWATAKRSGYEVYLLEAPYKDPAGCTARNVHGFSLEAIEKMAGQWEEAPNLYLQLDVKSLFHGDDLKESNIQEVDMDMDDGDLDEGSSKLEERKPEKVIAYTAEGVPRDGSPKEKRWNADGDNPQEEVKDLGHSKWLGNLEDNDVERTEVAKGKLSALAGLLGTYGKEGKSVHWGDQVGNMGFAIGALKKANLASLVIGPGAGYNLNSNPLPEEDTSASSKKTGETKRRRLFQEQLRAESESFRAIFDRRRQRIGGLDAEDE
ncbi:hypothetical protein Ancab_008099 [Ancistrocladus abbreviatus]